VIAMSTPRLVTLALVLLLAGCQRPATPAPPSNATAGASAPAVDSFPPDTHILDLDDGTEVWLTVGRVGQGPNGTTCLERGVQLRRGPLKMPVPLLYTSKLPVVLNGKIVASLSTNCVSGDDYAIDPKTAQPTKLEHPGR
jgi:hypothetical protein